MGIVRAFPVTHGSLYTVHTEVYTTAGQCEYAYRLTEMQAARSLRLPAADAALALAIALGPPRIGATVLADFRRRSTWLWLGGRRCLMADAIEDRGVVFFRHRGDLLFTPPSARGQALLAPTLVFQAGLLAALQAEVAIKSAQCASRGIVLLLWSTVAL